VADLSDVENALLSLVAAAAYPNGTTSPSAVPPSVVQLSRGWPDTTALAKSLTGSACQVTVYSLPGGSRNTSRYARDWSAIAFAPSTIQAASTGNVVTFSGTATAGQAAGISAARIGFGYAVQSSDTPSSIAAAIATQINSDGRLTGSASGASVTVTDGYGTVIPALGVTAGAGTSQRELRRQEQRIMVTVWAPNPDLRDGLTSAIDAVLAGTDWLTLSDGTEARIRYAGTSESDQASQAELYRRDVNFTVEYATTQTGIFPQMLFPIGLLHSIGVNTAFGTNSPISGALTPDGGQTILTDAGGNILVQPSP
jgi:hypothetical protein